MQQRFLDKVRKTPSCWLWEGQIYPTGYGNFWMNNKNVMAHRAAYLIFLGEIEEGKVVCHRCDNPSCVNPDHLFLGTYKENTRDMMRKGRKPPQKSRLNILNQNEIIKRYLNGETQRNLAKEFKVHQRSIWRYIHKVLPVGVSK